MRVITGSARGHRLLSIPGYDTRPTTSRVKEAIMSAIHFEIPESHVLDLFAGTGQLGIEALSRGAKDCVFVELDSEADSVIRENLKRTHFSNQARRYKADVLSWLARTNERFDIVFIDPPYDKDILPEVLPLVEKLMNSHGVIVCESALTDMVPEAVGRFSIFRSYNYGKRKVTMYRLTEPEKA